MALRTVRPFFLLLDFFAVPFFAPPFDALALPFEVDFEDFFADEPLFDFEAAVFLLLELFFVLLELFFVLLEDFFVSPAAALEESEGGSSSAPAIQSSKALRSQRRQMRTQRAGKERYRIRAFPISFDIDDQWYKHAIGRHGCRADRKILALIDARCHQSSKNPGHLYP